MEIDVLLCLERMATKEVAHLLKSFEFADSQTEPVVVITANDARLKETFQSFEHLAIPLMLDDHELGKHLVTRRHFFVPVQADMKAALAVDEADDPFHTQFHSIFLRKNRILGVWPLRIPA